LFWDDTVIDTVGLHLRTVMTNGNPFLLIPYVLVESIGLVVW